jgi:hypothetical protein
VLADMGRSEEAERSYRHAISLAPQLTQAQNNLGSLLSAGAPRRGRRHFPRGAGAKSAIHTRVLQPRRNAVRPGEAGGGGRILPPSTSARAGACRSALGLDHLPARVPARRWGTSGTQATGRVVRGKGP